MIDNLTDAIAHAKKVAMEKREEEQALRDRKDFIESNERNPKGIYDVPINQCKECAADHEQLVAWLTELQERREADRWIPVSERLPEKDGYYLITRLNYGEAVTDKRSFNRRNGYGSFVCNNVTAWKEMPKPYESEE